ncbi:CBASS oligonucleotide cyclase [Hyphomicrobium sp.]|uniref:CBASS oligonucleotide cyclase n=1 Tax=Hyphomicrobium sp. TaxID=82 RepID=UPI002E30D5A3|nr:CBASS oligonucleotide cyclase [Hyphomicrobium sp.]HEX2841382.1 CBASS oligonucleotide cyclase [Hyphomicrobium sp.]
MATTIAQGFKKLSENLEITDLQETTVSSRQKNVRAAVDNGLTVLEDFLTGSYKRSTMIAPLKEADVDIFAVLDPKHYKQNDPASVLEATKTALKKTYKTPKISPNGQAVTITFDDFIVDVVPGFYRTGGGYLIADTERSRWIATDPKMHLDIWTTKNKAHGGDLIPMIKIIKGWNKSRKLLRSFHLEVLALAVFEGITISDFQSGARYFFDKARAIVPVKLADPAGYSDDVATYISTQKQIDDIVNRLKWAYDTALEAENLASSGKISAAFERWQKIFPGYFPAYG